MENTADFLQKRKLRNGLVKPNLSFLGLAEDKRFTQFAVPESAFAIRSASSTAAPLLLSLYRPPDALGSNAHAAERVARLESSSLLQKKKIRRKSVRPFSGGGQEIRTLAPR